MKRLLKIFLSTIFFMMHILLMSCVTQTAALHQEENNIVCEGAAPQICTMEYKPVCGFKNQQSITYGNACSACGDTVDFYWVGECSN